jgi:hypothetical protein
MNGSSSPTTTRIRSGWPTLTRYSPSQAMHSQGHDPAPRAKLVRQPNKRIKA